jgi:hypothetical protein
MKFNLSDDGIHLINNISMWRTKKTTVLLSKKYASGWLSKG